MRLLPKHVILIGCLFLGLSFGAVLDQAHAQTQQQSDLLELRNGDQLGGRILPNDDDSTILFEHPVLGLLTIPVSEARVLSGAQPPHLPADPAIAARKDKREAGDPLSTAEMDDSTKDERRLSPNGGVMSGWRDLLGLVPLLEFVFADDPFTGWKHRLTLGYRWNSGKFDSQQFVGRFNSSRKIDNQSDLNINIVREYAFYRDTNDLKVITGDLLRGEMRFRRQWSDFWFVQSTNRYRREPTRNVEHDFTASGGIGYRFVNTEKWVGNFVTSATFNYLEANPPTFNRKDHILATFNQDLTFKFNSQWSISQRAEYNHDFDEERGSFGNASVRLTTRMFGGLSFVNRYEVIYDERGPANVDKYERRFLSELVYEF